MLAENGIVWDELPVHKNMEAAVSKTTGYRRIQLVHR